MKKKILFGLLCLMSVATLVNAQESYEQKAPWNTILKDGVLHVDATLPKEGSDYKTDLYNILNKQYKSEIEAASTRKQGEDHITVTKCYDVFATCELNYESCDMEGECEHIPVVAQMMWKKSAKDILDEIAPNGILTLNVTQSAIQNIADEEFQYYISFDKKGADAWLKECNKGNDTCTLSVSQNNEIESKQVKLKYQEVSKEAMENVNTYLNKLKKIDNPLETSDMPLIKSVVNEEYFDSLEVLQKQIESLNNDSHITVEMEGGDICIGLGKSCLIINGGWVVHIFYDNTLVSLMSFDFIDRNVIYVPSDTENTSEAMITAAKKKIDEYFGTNDIQIVESSKLKDFSEQELEAINKEIDLSLAGNNLYTLKINDKEYAFLIVRDSIKAEESKEETINDTNFDIKISFVSVEVPIDTILKVAEITKDSKLYTNSIKFVLKIGDKENVQIYDFALYSETLNKNITALENGEFKVTVPLKESLRGKKLVAYYITEDNKVEEHPVMEKDGMGTFTTNHFSVYTIAEARGVKDGVVVEVPKTYDGIMNSIILGVVGLVGLGAAIVVMKKKEN